MSFSGPTARRDAERAEKSRWLAHLATLLVGTQTPLGQRLVEKPATCNNMGLGIKSGTLRNDVHALARHLASSSVPVLGGASARLLGHHSLVYLEEISEISPAARLTVRPRYSNLHSRNSCLKPDRNHDKPHDLSSESWTPSRGRSSITENRYSSVCMGGSTCCRRGAL